MSHPLENVIRNADGLLLIGDSSEDRFPAFSYHIYSKAGKRFYCLDLGGLTVSRGPTSGGKVYTSVDELPGDRSDLALIWVKPKSAKNAVNVAHQAGCKRVWFSFGTGHRDAVARARELDMDVMEIGRCPILYMDNRPHIGCKLHATVTKATGLYQKPPQVDPDAKRREMA